MIAVLIWESLHLWPIAAAVAAVSSAVVLWLYPAQVRTAPSAARWLPPLMRWAAVCALSLALLKPAVLQPKTAEEWGAVVILLDTSKSMSVTDVGRTPAQLVAMAHALGQLPSDARKDVGSSLAARIESLDGLAEHVLSSQSDLEYARVSGHGVAAKQSAVERAAAEYARAAKAAASDPAGAAVKEGELHARLADLQAVPDPNAHDAWANDVKQRIDRALAAARDFQSAADAQLYQSNAEVRSACDRLAALSRVALAEQTLLDPHHGLLARLDSNVPVMAFAVDQGIRPIELANHRRPVNPPHLSADGVQSDLNEAIASALTSLGGRPARAIVLLTDGRQVGGRGELISGVRPSGVPVFTVNIAPAQSPDVSFARVSIPQNAFVGEIARVDVEVRHTGVPKPPSELHVTTPQGELIQPLLPRASSELAARFNLPIDPLDPPQPVRRVVLSLPPVPGETTTANNQIERRIKVSNDRMRVAVCTAAPTWDFQYFRNALARSPWVKLESRVLNPAAPKLGLTPEQILAQDVLVLSDVPVGALDANQWDAVNEVVKDRGGSVLLIAGQQFPLNDYVKQSFAAELLPFTGKAAWKKWPGEIPAFQFVPTPQGEHEGLRLADTAEGNLRRWQELPGVYQYLQIPELKPDVRKLLVEADSGAPVLTERRLGLGRTFFVGVNETWRWRLKTGERDEDRFWRQLVRYAAGEPYAASAGPLALDVNKVSAAPGETLRIRARARGAKFPPPNAGFCPIQILRDDKVVSTQRLTAIGGGRFAGELRDLLPGDYIVQLQGTDKDNKSVAARVPLQIAADAEAEMANISGDPDRLRRIAQISGGEYFPLDQVNRLAERLNAIHETGSQFTRKPLWNSPYLYALVLGCFAGEWALRKRLGLA